MFHVTLACAGLVKRPLSERKRAGKERAREEGELIGRRRRQPLASDSRFAKVRDLVLSGRGDIPASIGLDSPAGRRRSGGRRGWICGWGEGRAWVRDARSGGS
jgi:hypothetical protein